MTGALKQLADGLAVVRFRASAQALFNAYLETRPSESETETMGRVGMALSLVLGAGAKSVNVPSIATTRIHREQQMDDPK